MELANLTWRNIDALDRDTPVIIPVAALEQHGHHMPMFTDSILLEEIVGRAHAKLADRTLLVPLMWLGNSHHHLDFPGTVSADPRLWIDLLSGIIDNFITHRFRRIFVVNGHGGNDVPGRQALFEIRQKYRDRNDLLLLLATYWHLADPSTQIRDLQQSEMQHAGEWETSMMLQLRPELVQRAGRVPSVASDRTFLPAHRAWTIPDVSVDGHIGDPAAATAEKGEQLLAVFAESLIQLIERVIDWDGKPLHPSRAGQQ